jgi:ribosomal biogenesis protein LAS1
MPPAPQHVALWSPLVSYLHSRHPTFPSTLLSRIIKQVASPSQVTSSAFSAIDSLVGDVPTDDPTYNHTLASWVLWLVDQWGNDSYAGCERSEVIRELLLNLGRADDHRT